MTSPTIKPARGLWAAVKDGDINHRTVNFFRLGARRSLEDENRADFVDLAARGWRIIRVDVIPHEDEPVKAQENE